MKILCWLGLHDLGKWFAYGDTGGLCLIHRDGEIYIFRQCARCKRIFSAFARVTDRM
jgi:hypothetical protein